MGRGDRTKARARLRHAGAAVTLAITSVLMGCSPQIDRHGHHFSDIEIRQVQPGMSKDQVKATLGTPDTTATSGGEVFYYISSTKKTIAFMKPEETDRKVLAVYFNGIGSVDRVANYGLKDGKVIDLIRRETPSSVAERNFLNQLFRNLGTKQLYGD